MRSWYAKEVSDVLLPGWHAVAATNQFPKNVKFYNFRSAIGHPVILRRERDEIHGFLNICPHRFSKLNAQSCLVVKQFLSVVITGGSLTECSGHTRRIPDAPSFRPLKKGQFGLREGSGQNGGGAYICFTVRKTSVSNQALFGG